MYSLFSWLHPDCRRLWSRRKISQQRYSGKHLSLEPLEPRELLTADLVISELVARNDTGLLDYNFEDSDWFEVHNRGTSLIDLKGWYFTDNLDNVTKWQVPVSTFLAPDDRLVVFASNKDFVAPNGELHTNFVFSGSGESVGLADPTGQLIVSVEFSSQSDDISFGIDEDVQVTPLVARGAAAKALVPTDGSLGNSWTGGNEPFNEGNWTSGTTGVGYETGQAGTNAALPIAYWNFDELLYEGTVASDAWGRYDGVVSGAALTTGQQGKSGEALLFDGDGDYVLPGVIAEMANPAAFSISLWFRRGIDHSGTVNATNHSVNNVLIAQSSAIANDNLEIGTEGEAIEIYLDTAELGGSIPAVSQPASIQNDTWHHLVVTYDDSSANELKIYIDDGLVAEQSEFGGLVADSGLSPFTIGLARPGGAETGDFEGVIDELAVWDAALDVEHVTALFNGTSPLLLSGYEDFVGLDLASTLQNNNTSAYIRVPFTATDPESFDLLQLQMQYDDAFVASINGTEVARAGVTGSVQWNSAAISNRPLGVALLAEDFFIANQPGLLVEGQNVLAIQLLNFDAATTRTVVFPELTAIQSQRAQVWIDESVAATAWVPANNTLGTHWTGGDEPFNDAGWWTGTTGVGYDTGSGGPVGGPVAYWPLDVLIDGGTTAPDSTGNYDGVVSGAVLTSGGLGKFGEALSFDGDNDSISAGVITEMVSPAAFSTSLWFRRTVDHAGTTADTNHQVNNVLIGQSSNSSNDNLEIGTEGDFVEMYLDTAELGGGTLPVREQVPIQNDTWHHLVVTYDSENASELSFYLDGVLVSQYSQYGGIVAHGGMSPLAIGLSRPGQNEWGDFEGLIDDVAIWDSALGSHQVTALFNGTSPLLLSGYDDRIGIDLEAPLAGQNNSAYARIPFIVDDPNSVVSLDVKLQYDDAFVAYINGTEVARSNFTGVPQFDSAADTDRQDIDALTPEKFFVVNQPGLLQAGINILAIQVLAAGTETERLLMLPELEVVTVPNRAFAFMETPTPGTANGTDFAAVAMPVNFSISARTFTSDLQLELTSEQARSEIRYTTDRSLPTETSPLYKGPILISETTMVRARVYGPDMVSSESVSQTYIELGGPLVDDSSNLPLIVIDNFGQRDLNDGFALSHRQFQNGSLMLFEPDATGRSHLTDTPTFTSRSGTHRRGNSSFSNPKPSLRLELRDENDEDLSASLLGLTSDADWVLSGPYDEDRSLIRNSLVHAINREVAPWAPNTRFVEVYYNTNGGALNFTNEYMGVYVLKEKVEINPDRIDIFPTSSNDNFGSELTGGYLFEINNPKIGDDGWRTSRSKVPFVYVDPNSDEVTAQQMNYLQNYVQDFEDAAFSVNFKDPEVGFRAFLDTDSLINHHLQRFMYDEPQGFVVSEFWFKDRNGKLQQGPVWDSDRAIGNPHDQYDFFPTPTRTNFIKNYFSPPIGYEAVWLKQLFLDEDFSQDWVDRWWELRQSIFTSENFTAIVNSMAAEIEEGQERNEQRWREGFRGPYPEAEAGLTGWNAEISQIKGWLAARLDFVDSLLLSPVTLNSTIGVTAPYEVALFAPQGTIYYTLDGSDPRASGGQVSVEAIQYNGQPIEINETTRFIARAYNANAQPLMGTSAMLSQWSSPVKEDFILDLDVVITEINYNPYAPTDAEKAMIPNVDNDDFEFIELHNNGNVLIDMAGMRLNQVDVNEDQQGIGFVFAAQTLASDERIVVVRNHAAFQLRYGTDIRIADGTDGQGGVNGEYGGRLSNGGERITFVDNSQITTLSFDYQDGGNWPFRADGAGSSLEVVDSSLILNNSINWRASTEYGGSPGAAGVGLLETVIINEVLTNSDNPTVDVVELYNPTGAPVSIGGWWLSDKGSQLDQYVVADGVTIPAGGYFLFDETELGFGLNSTGGDQVWLIQPDGMGKPNWIVDYVEFGAAATGVSFGRFPNGVGDLFPMVFPTLAADNSTPRFGPIVISEVMYNPANSLTGFDAQSLEFVEIYNSTARNIDLADWRLQGTGNFEFPLGSFVGPGQMKIVVPFDPVADLTEINAFNVLYGVNIAAKQSQYLGPYSGRLDNGGEKVTLLRADSPPSGDSVTVPLLIEDQIDFDDAVPWPLDPDGGGSSLHRQLVDLWGNDPLSWTSGSPSPGDYGPGSVSTFLSTGAGDSVIGEVGKVASLTHEHQVITLNHTFSNPVVFAQPASYNGADPVAVRITDVQSDQFTLYLTEPPNANGLHGAGETVSYLVVEKGTHQLSGGKSLEVGTVVTTATVGFLAVNQWETINLKTTFEETPVAIAQIQSTNGKEYLQLRQRQSNASQLELALEAEEIAGSQQSAETVGYLVVNAGLGTWSGLSYEAKSTTNLFTHNFSTLDFSQIYSAAPTLLATLSTYRDVNNAHLRFRDLTTSGVDLKVKEDTAWDREESHFTEGVSYLAIDGPGLLSATGTQLTNGQTESFPIDISTIGRVADLNVKLDIDHSYVSDLNVVLVSPDGTAVELFSDVGGAGDDFVNTVLDNEAALPITAATAPFTGSFQPEGSLSNFNGRPSAGTWTLQITDDAANLDVGNVLDWSLTIDIATDPTGNVNHDSKIDADDIDLLYANLNTNDTTFDLNGDGQVDTMDRDELVLNRIGTQYGDANIDRKVDIADYNSVAVNFDPAIQNSWYGWAMGNFDGDDDVDLTDYRTIVLNYAPLGIPSPLMTSVHFNGNETSTRQPAIMKSATFATDQTFQNSDQKSEKAYVPRHDGVFVPARSSLMIGEAIYSHSDTSFGHSSLPAKQVDHIFQKEKYWLG